MTEIIDKLFLGGVEAALDIESLEKFGITHIITIDIRPLCQETTDKFTTKYIHAMDLEDTDLLTYIDECNSFIDDGLVKGGVLVHCFVGSSRSATIVIAYLMNKLNLTFQEALDKVKTLRPLVKPNQGFLHQLHLYESMGNKIDVKSNCFRQYRLNKLSLSVQAGQQISDHKLYSQLDESNSLNSYKCRKCRQALFKSSALLPHMEGKGKAAFDWRSRIEDDENDIDFQNKDKTLCDRSLFIEPLKWMSSYVHNMEGKILCPKCSAKIGSFIWYGERCPCGTWVAPAFHIQSSKVDLCKPINIVRNRSPLQKTETLKTDLGKVVVME
ncbi:hypothetical protein LOTGIDRAFT_125232 [Lottia gigantea]|uniref:Uncharacterized protein n=1 Tax=Lottia gigantea TaxID=225164 RepID=V3ZYI8_LOTGI|nr:hypothetical protein LOTGIDRAFT_125232 [Lottia gigantea]ESO89447.1 hypothetical protein LOTGIDRAFT_125232 [Lottia gigantea]